MTGPPTDGQEQEGSGTPAPAGETPAAPGGSPAAAPEATCRPQEALRPPIST